jgi:crossover junction endodeoxyribonuclease RuvC
LFCYNITMKILAIDPGYERLGLAVIEKKDGKEELLFSDCFKTSAKEEHSKRLLLIGQKIAEIIETYSPKALSIETLFFKTNAKTAMKVSEARGVIIYEAKKAGLDIVEFSPLQIKTAVTGYGKSDKSQVTFMVKRLIKIETEPKYDDEYDAIAVGLTYFATRRITK